MRDLEALRLALYLFHLPSAVRGARDNPLPEGIAALLLVAADDSGAAEAAAAKLERPVDVVRQACAFFIEQILLTPDADAYQVLGAGRSASDADLRRNMALMQRWVHPDMDRAGDRSVYAGRVTRAWEALKTQERRAAYDAANPPKPVKSRFSRSGRTSGIQPRRSSPSGTGRPLAAAAAAPRTGLIGAALRFFLRRRDPQG